MIIPGNRLNSKPRLTGIEDISEAKGKMKTTHVGLDAVYINKLKILKRALYEGIRFAPTLRPTDDLASRSGARFNR